MIIRNIWHNAGQVLILILLTGVVLSGCGGAAAETRTARETDTDVPTGQHLDPPHPLTDFTLTTHNHTSLSLSDLHGRVVLLYFGYTFCPDVCPATLADFVHVKRDLGDAAQNVAFVFISVDGERDTPEVLARYMLSFDSSFIGLQGDMQTLRRIGNDYGLFYERRKVSGTSAAYLIDHTASTYLIDTEGRLNVIYPFGTPPEIISADIRELLPATLHL